MFLSFIVDYTFAFFILGHCDIVSLLMCFLLPKKTIKLPARFGYVLTLFTVMFSATRGHCVTQEYLPVEILLLQ